MAICETLFRSRRNLIEVLKKCGLHILILMSLPLFSNFVFSHPFDTLWFLGGYEKYHGYLYYLSLIVFGVLVRSTVSYIRYYVVASILAGGVVSLIALGEYLGGGFDIYSGTTIHDTYGERSLGTLGNPNYLAGYLLGIIPITLSYLYSCITPRRYLYGACFIIVLILGLLTTGSYTAILLCTGASIYCMCRVLIVKNIQLFGVGPRKIVSAGILLVAGLSLYLILMFLDHDKWLSFLSRGVLVYESLRWILSIPFAWIFGLGPDALLFFFSPDRSPLMDQYFPTEMLIDSSHNIFLDMFCQYGIFPIVCIGIFLVRICRSVVNRKQDPSGIFAFIGIGVIVGFLSLNVAVVSHIILLVLSSLWYWSITGFIEKKS